MMKADELADAVMGRLIAGRDPAEGGTFTGVSIDSRSVRKGDVFFAIVGKRFDGHDFVSEAVRNGASGAVVARPFGIADFGFRIADCRIPQSAIPNDFALIFVKDTTEALQNLAAWHRRRFRCPMAAVTGSNGKTTTKDLTWAILSRRYGTEGAVVARRFRISECGMRDSAIRNPQSAIPMESSASPRVCVEKDGGIKRRGAEAQRGALKVLRTRGSKNNHIGVPLTLLELDEGTEAAVVELGTSSLGEIRDLVSICSPDVGCITNIGAAHLEFFGTVGNVARAKAELLEGMREGCPVVLNADDDWFDWLRRQAKGPVVSFGIHRPAVFTAEEICATDGALSFQLVSNVLGARRRISMPFAGGHNVYNALAAAAISSQLGAGISDIEEGLGEARLPSMRFEVMTLSGVRVINDAYNANPGSTRCALSSFCEMSVCGRRIFVCGAMLELGRHAAEAHRQIGSFIKSMPIDYVIALGELAALVVEAAFGPAYRGAGADRPGGERSVKSSSPLRLCVESPKSTEHREAKAGRRWACCQSVEEVVSVLREVAVPGDAVLIKGSRANGMERIVDALNGGQSAVPKNDLRSPELLKKKGGGT